MRRAARVACLAAGAASVALAACTDVGTDPGSVVSIKSDTTPVVSVIVGDTLRDTSGAPLPLLRLGKAYNGQGQPLASPGVQILLTPIDSLQSTTPNATIVHGSGDDSASSYLVALPLTLTSSSAVKVNLQFTRALRLQQRIDIVPRPDLVVADTAAASAGRLTFSDTVADSGLVQFGVRVTHDSLPGVRAGVRQTLVRFDLASPPQSPRIDRVRFVEAPGRDSSLTVRFDTTDANGVATRQLWIYRSAVGKRRTNPGRDTIGVRATVVAGARPFLSIPLLLTVIDTPSVLAATSRAPASVRRP